MTFPPICVLTRNRLRKEAATDARLPRLLGLFRPGACVGAQAELANDSNDSSDQIYMYFRVTRHEVRPCQGHVVPPGSTPDSLDYF